MPDFVQPLGFREMLLDVLRTSVRHRRLNAIARITQQSGAYRKKAAELARVAESETDELKILPLVHQALSWVQLAENEEILAETTSGNG